MLEHIKDINPDVIGLSEVDSEKKYSDELIAGLEEHGYSVTAHYKEGGPSGSLIAWNKSKIELVDRGLSGYPDSSQFLLYALLSVGQGGKKFVFCETHLKAKVPFMDKRVMQTQSIVKFFQ